MTEPNDDSAFLQPHIRSRRIQKIAKALPKRPRKRKEVISALTNKFRLRIKPTQQKTGRPKNELTESEKEWLKNVLDKPRITCVTPGWKDHRYCRKVDGRSQYVQKRYLMWTVNDLFNIANRNSVVLLLPNMRKCLFRCESLNKKLNKKFKRCNMGLTDSNSLLAKYAILLQELACFQKMNIVTLLVWQWRKFWMTETMQSIRNGLN